MIQRNGSPFRFGELKGTSWHKRFLAEEYTILLDQYPQREIIEDQELTALNAKNDKRIGRYKDLIRNYLLNSGHKIESNSFWDILLDLRTIKKDLFPEIDFSSEIPSEPLPDLQAIDRISDWNKKLSAYALKRNKNSSIFIQKELKEKFQESETILFIPGKPGYFESDLTVFLKEFAGKKSIRILCFDNVLYRGVSRKMASRILKKMNLDIIELIAFDPEKTNNQSLQDTVSPNGLIFTTGIWPFLGLFKKLSPLAFFIDNREWCSRGLIQRSNELFIAGYQNTPFPEGINISGVQYSSLSIFDHMNQKEPRTFLEKTEENRLWLHKGKRYNSAEYNSSFYKMVNKQSTGCNIGDSEAVLVTSVLLNETDANVKPILLDSMTNVEELKTEGTGFLSSFNYYFTDTLAKVYNKQVPPEQQLDFNNFFIDYMGIFDKSKRYESLPLYNKALLGCSKKGTLFSGHYSVGKVTMKIDDQIYSFEKDAINCTEKEDSNLLYLPGFTEKTVGKGRYCLAIVQNRIIYQGTGPCRIPPAGAVVILKNGIPRSGKADFSVDFKDLPVKKSDIQWMIGGFNLLVKNGVNSYENREKAFKSLQEEGWDSPQSEQTQETQLDPEKRQPRCVFGRTTKERLLLAIFSGRTEISGGATFSESISHVQSLLKDDEELDFLINFDGGASASLIAYNENHFKNLSLTAPSAVNPVGTARRLNAYFSIKLKEPE